MIAFTVIGVLWFWMFCFELGRGLGWLTEGGGAAIYAVARFLLVSTGMERAARDVMLSLGAYGVKEGGNAK